MFRLYFTSKALYETEDESDAGEVEGPERKKKIKKGDKINLHDLLFTKDRDYLVRYQDNQRVRYVYILVIYFLTLPEFVLLIVYSLCLILTPFLGTRLLLSEMVILSLISCILAVSRSQQYIIEKRIMQLD